MGAPPVLRRGAPGEVDPGAPAGCCREAAGGAGHGGAGRGAVDVGGGAAAVGVDAGDAVVAGVAAAKPAVRVGGGGIARVGDKV